MKLCPAILLFPFFWQCQAQNQNVFFVIYTRANKTNGIVLNEESNLTNIEGFSRKFRNYFIVHGFQSSASSSWVPTMATALLQKNEYSNVFAVDWSSLAMVPTVFDYETAVGNIYVAIREIRNLLQVFIEQRQILIANGLLDVHCIG
jgi:hypothetical protein